MPRLSKAKRIEAAVRVAMRKARRRRNRGRVGVRVSSLGIDGVLRHYAAQLVVTSSPGGIPDMWEVRTLPAPGQAVAFVWEYEDERRAARDLASRLFEREIDFSVAS